MVEFNRETDSDEALDREFRSALRPVLTPDGFADRVIARTRGLEKTASRSLPVRRRGFHPTLRWGIAALLLLAMTFGGVLEHQRQRRIAGEHARQQVLLALRITTAALHAVRDSVNKNSTN